LVKLIGLNWLRRVSSIHYCW